MLGQPVPAARAPWIFSEVAGVTVDVIGAAASGDDAVVWGGVHAHVSGGRVVQVTIIDGAVEVETARRLVEEGGTPQQLAGRWPIDKPCSDRILVTWK